MTGKQNGKLQKNKFRSNRSSAESPQKDDGLTKAPDLSLLRKPIHTSVTGFAQARDVFDTGTEEIKQLLSTECDVIYECRVCRNLFRSLANFISHKRIYCRQKFNTSLHAHFINTKYLKDDMMAILENEQEYQNFLHNKHYSSDIVQAGKESLQKPFSKDLTSVIERLTLMQTASSDDSEEKKCPSIKTQPTSHTPHAVFQSVVDSTGTQEFIKEQVHEMDRLELSQEVTLGPDGKILTDVPIIHISDEEDESTTSNIVCRMCKLKFSTQKTLRFHLKHKHAENRLVYPCPDCEETFANAWGVYRHLYKIHRKSAPYIRKLRESIHNKAFTLQRKRSGEKSSNLPEDMELSEQQRLDLENQEWMDNLEGDCEVPRCGGCGRKFERRAALSSHRQTCQLRIAAQNKITTNLQKRQAARTTTKETPTTQVKTETEKADVSPAKVARLETKPIEIQIRRDYHKGPIGSPKRTGTPSVEPNGNVSEGGEVMSKGEKGDISIVNTHVHIINKHCNETVKDYDDANVVSSLCVSHEEQTELFTSIKCTPQSDENTSSEMDDDDELNFEDIRRICQANKECEDPIPVDLDDIEVIASDESRTAFSSQTEEEPKQCETSFTCNKCNQELTSLDDLNGHIKNKHEAIIFQCKFCNYKSKRKRECINHVKVKHKMQGDDERIGKFVNSSSVPRQEASVDSSDEEIPVTTTGTTMDDDVFFESAILVEPAKMENISPSINMENISVKEEIQSNSSASANCSDVEGDAQSLKRKRGRPRKDDIPLPTTSLVQKQMAPSKKSEIRLPLKGAKSSSVNNKKEVNVESAPTSCQYSIDVEDLTDSSPEKEKNKQSNSALVKMKSEPIENSEKKKLKVKVSDTQHSASSMSSSVKRPIRNRVKPLNKDFEYDLSNLLKLEAEAYKESHLPTVIHKQPLKRKPLLQNETTSSDVSTGIGEQKENAEVKKSRSGALQSLSLKAAEKMKAHMRQIPLNVQKELPAFIAQRRSRSTPGSSPKATSPQQTPKKEVPALPKMKMDRNAAQQQITPSMIYEKLSLDNSRNCSSSEIVPTKKKVTNTNDECKNEILTKMSKILSKSIKISSKIKRELPKNPSSEKAGDETQIGFISVKKEKDLLCPSLLKKTSMENDSKGKTIKQQDLVRSKSDCDPKKVNEENIVEDETSEFVVSEKLTSVNILRRSKSSINSKSEKKGSSSVSQDKNNIMIALTKKFYKKKSPSKDAVSLVDVSETTSSNSSVILNDEEERNSTVASVRGESPVTCSDQDVAPIVKSVPNNDFKTDPCPQLDSDMKTIVKE